MKIRLSYKNIIAMIMLLTPFIDIANGIMRVQGASLSVSIGQIVRIVLLVIMLLILLLKDRNTFLFIILLVALIVIRDIVYIAIYSANFFNDISCDLRYIYVLTFGLVTYKAYKRNEVSKEELLSWAKRYVAIVAIVTVVTNLFLFGLDYVGTKRLFTEVNALTAVLVWGVSMWIHDLFMTKFSIKNLIVSLMIVYAAFSQATKTGVIGVIVCFIYMFYYIGVINKRFAKQIVLGVLGLIGAFVLYRYFTAGTGTNIFSRWQYFYLNLDAMSFLLSGRNSLLDTSIKVWTSDWLFIFCGTGYSVASKLILAINSSASYIGAEMDIFDIVIYYGIIVGLVVFIPLLRVFGRSLKGIWTKTINSYYKFGFIIISIVAFLGGHVLSSPMAGIFFCVAFILVEDRFDETDKMQIYNK